MFVVVFVGASYFTSSISYYGGELSRQGFYFLDMRLSKGGDLGLVWEMWYSDNFVF